MLQRHILAFALLIILGALAYSNSLSNQFVFDDNYQVVRNPYLHGDESLAKVLFSDVWGYQTPGRGGVSNYYRPLQMLSYRWTAQTAGLNPVAFHVVNLVFHLLASAMGYFLLWRWSRDYWVALSASVLFVLHPIHTEAVTWIASLPELGCALFYFLAFWCFMQSVPEVLPTRQKKKVHPRKNKQYVVSAHATLWRLASLASFGVALLWKEMAVTLPVLIAAYMLIVPAQPSDWWSRFKRGLQFLWPYLLLLCLYLLLRYQVLGYLSRSQHGRSLTLFEYVLNVIHLVGKYWLKLILPVPLNAFYVFEPVHSVTEPRLWGATALIMLVVWWLIYELKRSPLLSFLAAWVFLTLIPVLHLRGIGANAFTERYLYIPSLGFCLLAVYLAQKTLVMLSGRGRFLAGMAGMALLSIGYMAMTIGRNADWRDDLTFFSRALEASPNSSSLHSSYAHVLRAEKGDVEAAEYHSRLALSLADREALPDPRVKAVAFLNLANIYIQRRQYTQALEMAEKGLAADRSQPNLHTVHGVALMQLGRTDEAQKVFLEVNQLLPNDELVLNYLGVIALQRREFEQAIVYFQKALKILPSYADAHNNLAAAYVEMGRPSEALPHLEQAARLNARDPMTQTNLAAVLADLGRIPEARSHLRQALALAPNFAPAMAELTRIESPQRQSP